AQYDHALWQEVRAERVAHLEHLAALEQPLLHDLEAADGLDTRDGGDVLDEAGAIHDLALLLEQRRDRALIELSVDAERPAGRVQRLVHRQALERARERGPGGIAVACAGP